MCKAYTDMKRLLRDREIEYSIEYPSKLQIMHIGKAKVFSTLAEVQIFLDANDRDREVSAPNRYRDNTFHYTLYPVSRPCFG